MKWLLLTPVGFIVLVVIIGFLLPQAHTASRTIRLRRPASDVFAVLVSPPNWRPDVKTVEQLPSRDGHRTWKENGVTYEELEAEPPKRLVTRIADKNLPYGGTWTHELQPEADGCRLTITENGEVYNPIFRFVSKFVMGHTATIDAYLKSLQAKLGDA